MSPAAQLLDLERRQRERGRSRALVPIDRSCCPSCGAPTIEVVMAEDALFFFGGYGATRRTTAVVCVARWCLWSMVAEVTETRPPR